MLIVLSGLPGVGKTTIARALAAALDAVHVRIDTIEQDLRDRGVNVTCEGYDAGRATAAEHLRSARNVVADCVNPWPETREAWRETGANAGAPVLEVEVICSDAAEHRRRVESRLADIPGHQLPSWVAVLARDYRPWTRDRLIVDTARTTVSDAVRRIVAAAG